MYCELCGKEINDFEIVPMLNDTYLHICKDCYNECPDLIEDAKDKKAAVLEAEEIFENSTDALYKKLQKISKKHGNDF